MLKPIRVMRSLVTTIIASLQIHYMTDHELKEAHFNWSKDDLLKDNFTVGLGNGLQADALTEICSKYKYTRVSLDVFPLQRMDEGMRMILRHLRDHEEERKSNLEMLECIRANALLPFTDTPVFLPTSMKPITDANVPPAAAIPSSARLTPIVESTTAITNSVPSIPSTVPKIKSIQVKRMSPDGCQCWWNCVVYATKKTKSEIQQIIRGVVDSMISETLLEFDFWGRIDPPWKSKISNPNQVQLTNAKLEYFASDQFKLMMYAGTREMLIFAYATKYFFRVIKSSEFHTQPEVISSPKDGVGRSSHEITIHHCIYGDINFPNHYDLFEYTLESGKVMYTWPLSSIETPAELAHRHQLLQQAADWAAHESKREVRKGIDTNLQAALKLHKELNGEDAQPIVPSIIDRTPIDMSTPPSTPPPIATKKERKNTIGSPPQVKRHTRSSCLTKSTSPKQVDLSKLKPTKVDSTVTPAPTTPPKKATQQTNSIRPPILKLEYKPQIPRSPMKAKSITGSGVNKRQTSYAAAVKSSTNPLASSDTKPSNAYWKQARVHALREIHRANIELHVQASGALFTAYQIYSDKKDTANCARVAKAILDYPSKTLIKPNNFTRAKFQKQFAQSEAHTILEEAKSAPVTVLEINPSTNNTSSTVNTDSNLDTPSIVPPMSDSHIPPIHVNKNGFETPEAPAKSTPSTKTHSIPSKHPTTESDDKGKSVKNAERIIKEGGAHAIKRGIKYLDRAGIAEMSEATLEALRKLHPQAPESLPPLSDDIPITVAIDNLGHILSNRIDNGSAPGPSGWSGSHVNQLYKRGTVEMRKGLELFILDIMNGKFRGEIHQRLLACKLIPLKKSDNGIRPIAVGEVFTKCAAHCAMSLIEDKLKKLFPSIQYGVKMAGGAETASQLMKHILAELTRTNKNRSIIAIKTDFKNAFNSMSRKLIWETLLKREECALAILLFPLKCWYQFS